VKATKDKIENHQAYLTIEAEPAEVEKFMQVAYHHLVEKTNIPGFRKGKTPRAILERYIGKERLFEDALDHLVPELYKQALVEQAIEPVSQGQVDITQTEPIVIFKAIVPLKPTVKLGDYHKIDVQPTPVEVTESNINDVIEQLRHQHATWEPVDRPVEFGDMVVFDIDSTVEGQSFISQKGSQYQLAKDLTTPFPGFGEQLIGMKKGEEKEFKLKLPDDYARKEIAGKEAVHKVKVTEIKIEKLPEVDENLAKTVSAELTSADGLRELAAKELRQRGEERNQIEFEEKLMDGVVKISDIQFPPVLVDAEITRILGQRFQNNRQTLDNYLKTMNKTEEEVRNELKPSAESGVKRSLILSQLVADEKIEVTDADVNAEIEKMTQETTSNKEKVLQFFNTPDVRKSISQTLLTRKTLQVLKDITQANAPKEEPKAAKETKETKEPPKRTRKKKEEDK
jgi:trigger factor